MYKIGTNKETNYIAIGGSNGFIQIVDGNKITTVSVVNGKANMTLENLTVGNHNITVNYSGDSKYDEVSKNTTLEVSKVEISDENMTVDAKASQNSAVIDITLPSDASGTVTVTVDDNKTYTEKVVDGKASVTAADLSEGKHNITVTYSDDDKYADKTKKAEVTIEPKVIEYDINATVENATEGLTKIIIETSSDATGEITVKVGDKTYSATIKDAKAVIDASDLPAGKYTAEITYEGNYPNKTTTFDVEVLSKVKDYDVNATVEDATEGSTKIIVETPSDATGDITVKVGDKTYTAPIKDGKATVDVSNLSKGKYTAEITYSGDDKYANKTITKDFEVDEKIDTIIASNIKRGQGSPYDYQAKFLDKKGNPLANKNVNFVIKGKKYTVKTDKNGVAKLTESKLAPGTYEVTCINPVTGEKVTAKTTIVKRLLKNKDIVKDYSTSKSYKVLVIGDNGKAVGAGVTVVFKVHGVTYKVKTDKNGYATRTIGLNPGKYTITAQYVGCKVSNKVTVKQVLTSSNVNVKKSAKSFTLKATLKTSGGKVFVGKKVTFTFKGVDYTVKTNKNGVASVKIPKSVINTLKTGSKYQVTIKYIDDKIKKQVIVK